MTTRQLQAAIRRQVRFDAGINSPVGSYERSEAEYQLRSNISEAYAYQATLLRKAKAAERKVAEPVRSHHCQVCGRAILDTTGVIAHHGYTRPEGWHQQTASCAGARYVAYEISCDRLKEVAGHCANWIKEQEKTLANFILHPPQTLTHRNKNLYTGKVTYTELTLPEGFTGEPNHRPCTYAHQYNVVKYDMMSKLKSAKSDLRDMNRRIEEWKEMK
jgi:hypothetical protein